MNIMYVEMKVDGRIIQIETNTFDQSWLDDCLRYGVKQRINDKYSSFKGSDKYDACMTMKLEMESGSVRPEKVSAVKIDADPTMTLALTNAKTDLKAMWKAKLGITKIAQFAANDSTSKYFKEVGNSMVWNEYAIESFIEAQAEAGKKDYLADAEAILSATDDVEIDW